MHNSMITWCEIKYFRPQTSCIGRIFGKKPLLYDKPCVWIIEDTRTMIRIIKPPYLLETDCIKRSAN